MVKEYTCENCGKIFYQKGQYSRHLIRKRPCKKKNVSLKKDIQKTLNELSQNGDIEIKNKNLIVNNPEDELSNTMDIQNKEGIQYLSEIDDNSVDLVLTDPPYITSSETGMGNLHKDIQKTRKQELSL